MSAAGTAAPHVAPRGLCLTIDRDLVAALAWCRLGGKRLGRPKDERAFERAKALGLLAQDDVWRTTDRGDGVLIAVGLLAGEPATRRTTAHVLWAACGAFPTPQFVAAFADGLVDSMSEEYRDRRHEAEQWFLGFDVSVADWRFWTTVEELATPTEVPERDGDDRG